MPPTFPGGQHWDAQGTCVRGSLTTLPASLSGLACLAHLDLSFNSLEMLPACVLQMSGLDSLLLSHNRLSELPAALGALSALTFFSATHNRLPTLPPALGALYALQRLDLSENLLDSLPLEIRSLRSLEELNLASNRLQSLPASLGEHQSCPPPRLPATAGSAPQPLPGLHSHGPLSSSTGPLPTRVWPAFEPPLLPGSPSLPPLPWPLRLRTQAHLAL